MKKLNQKELQLIEHEAEPALPAPDEIDAAESRWDPWLLALARMEVLSEARLN